MSTKRGTQHRRRHHPAGRGGLVAAQAGMCEDDGGLEELKRQTHDALIRQVGARRSGPVHWQVSRGDGARYVLRAMLADLTDAIETGDRTRGPEASARSLAGYYAEMLAQLKLWPHGVFVLAVAPTVAVPPASRGWA